MFQILLGFCHTLLCHYLIVAIPCCAGKAITSCLFCCSKYNKSWCLVIFEHLTHKVRACYNFRSGRVYCNLCISWKTACPKKKYSECCLGRLKEAITVICVSNQTTSFTSTIYMHLWHLINSISSPYKTEDDSNSCSSLGCICSYCPPLSFVDINNSAFQNNSQA